MKTKGRNTLRYIFLAIGILCVGYILALHVIGKSAGMLPFWLALGAVFIALSLRKVFDFLFSRVWIRIVFIVVIAAAVILEIAVIAAGSRALPQQESDYIIVLGAQVEGETPSQTLQDRLEAAYRYLTAYESSRAILSGGQCHLEDISEAEAMYRYLTAKGIDEDRLIKEDQAADTYENIMFSFALLGEQKDLSVCVVSSDYHILRAKMLAYKQGQQVCGYGAQTDFLLAPNAHLRELLAIVKDFVIQ